LGWKEFGKNGKNAKNSGKEVMLSKYINGMTTVGKLLFWAQNIKKIQKKIQ
jgi:hypothetical protein